MKIQKVKNEIVQVRQGSQIILDSNMLNYKTNTPTQMSNDVIITYEVLEIPEIGELMMKQDNEWVPAERFTQNDLELGRVKYAQEDGRKKSEVKSDSVLLEVTIPDSKTKIEARLNFEIIKIIFELNKDRITVRDNGEIVRHPLNLTISTSSLESELVEEDKIEFSFPEKLRFADLYQGSQKVESDDWFKLTELKILDLFLKLKSEVQFQTSEELKMVMKLPDGDETHLAVLITYYPNPAKIFVTNTGIEAVEGRDSRTGTSRPKIIC